MNTQAADKFTDFPDDDVGPVFVKSRRSFSVEGIARSIRNFATLSEALRMLGAAVLVASMSVFLLKGWDTGNDVGQYLLLLAQTGLLAAAGFAMSHGLRETRGARVFFGLALISICANFTILGAMVFSVLHWDIGLIEYPAYALWQIESLAGTSATFRRRIVGSRAGNAVLFCDLRATIGEDVGAPFSRPEFAVVVADSRLDGRRHDRNGGHTLCAFCNQQAGRRRPIAKNRRRKICPRDAVYSAGHHPVS